jgi:hypothetical protein
MGFGGICSRCGAMASLFSGIAIIWQPNPSARLFVVIKYDTQPTGLLDNN